MIDIDKVTIGQYVAYSQLLEKLQPGLDRLFPDKEGMSNLELFSRYPEYVEEIVKFWTGWESVKDKDFNLVLGLFAAIEKLSLIPEPTPLKAFEHEGEWYHAPQDVQLLQKTIPMGKATFGQALEALQIQQLMNGKHEMIPYVLATIFLREGETVDDISVTERAEIMNRLPITTAMNAYFFLARSAGTWLKRISRYLEAKLTQKQPARASAA
jgi:hypothetical protein